MPTTHALFDPFGAFAADDAARRETAANPRTLSYSALLGEAWSELPVATRDRFEQHDALYAGTMKLHASRAGRWVARFCRLIGSPLPPSHERPVPTAVRVEPDPATGGSRWTRSYAFPTRLTTIASVKALDVDGALVERLSFGLRMRLALFVRDGALCFDSTGYYVECPGLTWHGRRHCACRIPLPEWFLPGRTCVAHHDIGGGHFRFTMTIRHSLLGELFRHDGVFRSVE
jgi:hypothetical protein